MGFTLYRNRYIFCIFTLKTSIQKYIQFIAMTPYQAIITRTWMHVRAATFEIADQFAVAK